MANDSLQNYKRSQTLGRDWDLLYDRVFLRSDVRTDILFSCDRLTFIKSLCHMLVMKYS